MSERTARPAPARARLLAAAATEFYASGITATGIDAVISAAGVAKMSLYNNFASKDELVTAYLRERHEEWLGLFRARLHAASSPRERVLAVFDAYADHANAEYREGWRGCGLLNAAAELPAGHPGRAAVREHKDEVEAILAEHLAPLTDDPGPLAAHLALLLEGAMAKSGLEGSDAWVRTARGIAEGLLPVPGSRRAGGIRL
ncbi:TetR/AcrR family transcriptional regulator [Leucobacter sp. M11]|uniref:TetR/AcrR family transcriptional regulator n=1 Tax=Leucobacter sp. M11 TaxID=2993565 RepID=UPI002D8002F4|nr:TetR/AcrR family transcriptional regulator [Leucobacter sp. M11]MEB4615382.1 TetR/AcrR family transcriptional regulator [Leucobacter sp. M11]